MEKTKINYKETINLPQTDFPMKASLNQREPLQLKEWEEKNIYSQIRSARSGKPAYVLHDGPPYANGHIHMGHALNKILKDFVVKYKTLKGFDAPYIPGWDCHGLPIEHQLLKEKKQTIHQADQIKFRKEAHTYAMKWVETQKNEFKRLGVFGDWENPYLTLKPAYEATILETIRDIYKAGHVYKAKKPVYWSVGCETALAEAEVEYADHTSHSIYVPFQLKGKPDQYIVIWTTTPWTLPANLAVAVHELYQYVEVHCQNKTYIVAKDLAANFIEICKLENATLGQEKTGKELEGLPYHHPFIERESKVILSEYVTLDTGTGCVHTAPGHGQEDYIVGLRYGLDVFSPVDEKGRFTKEAGVFVGESVFEANEKIIELLKEKGALLQTGKIVHSYPHCWRSKKPIIFRATEQWFISMDKHGLRETSLNNIKQVSWIPSVGEARITSMVQSRPDWCISRQRLWGVPIPGLKCKDCGESFFDIPFTDRLIELVKKKGVNVWFENDATAFAPESTCCPECHSRKFEKEKDIVDVWFESGVSYHALLKDHADFSYPCDLYLEGSDQHRGWFQSSLMTASSLKHKAQYKSVLTHGFIVDGEGKKMSKSMGNVVDPLDIMNRYGADILRIWVASSDYTMDLRLSENHFEQLSDAYRKVRNTFRFLLGNLFDFKPESALPAEELLDVDKWILLKLKEVVDSMENDMDEYRYYRAWNKAYNFCNNELSAFYFNIHKDVLYCAYPKSKVRLSAQTAMDIALKSLVRVLFPFITYTCEEVWKDLSKKEGLATSIAVEYWPKVPHIQNSKFLLEKFSELFGLREEIFKKIEGLISSKTLNNSMQVELIFKCRDNQDYDRFSPMTDELKRFFVVSKVTVQKEEVRDENQRKILVDVLPMHGIKCQRCWAIFEKKNPDAPDICQSCEEVIQKISQEKA